MAEDHEMQGPPLPKFDCYRQASTLGTRWRRWLTSFELFADRKGLIINEETAAKVKQRRRALLLHHAGADVQDLFQTVANTGEPTDYKAAVDALNAYFIPHVNNAYARHQFNLLMPKEGESIRPFATRLRHAIRDCQYTPAEADKQIRDSILRKCKSDYLRRKLLEEGKDLTLARTLEIAEQCESIETHMAALSTTSGEAAPAAAKSQVNRVSSGGVKPKFNKGKGERSYHDRSKSSKACYRCGRTGHFGRDPECPARGKTCTKCNGKDHFAPVCLTKPRSDTTPRQRPSKAYTVDTGEEFAFAVNPQEPMISISVGQVPLKVLIDSGASSNIIDSATWEQLKKKGIKCSSKASSGKKLYTYASDVPLPVKGTFTCQAICGRKSTTAEFLVIDGNGVPLLGRDTAMNLGVLKIGVDIAMVSDKAKIQDMYPELFQGVGKLNTHQVKLHVNQSVEPVAQPLRRIPFNLRGKVEQKLDELLEADIIEPVDGATTWLNPVVIAPKPDGSIRLCLDMRRANEAIIRQRYPIPTVDDVLHNMNGSTVFSKLDLKWGYHQLELTPESRDITTFATHRGVYRYKRLLFGVSSASELYQHEVSTVLAGIEGVQNISDDVIVHGPTQKIHDQRLHAVLKRLRDRGLTLNQKCQFNMSKLVFMGIMLSEKGIGPTEERVRALVEAKEPENQSEVRSFLGLANYSARFIPQFSTLTEPLRVLLKKDVPFKFGPQQKKAFEQLKAAMAKASTLAFFVKDATTKVVADASPVGLGAVLLQEQNGREVPVCYASRSLTPCEQRYSQTEKEALSLVWACEKFHVYLYGRRFELVTDHKPLEVIYGPRSRPSARIERWVLRMQPYDFQVVHVQGHKNIADPLSRLVKQSIKGATTEDYEYVQFVASNATPRALTTREIEEASAEDEQLRKVRAAIETREFQNCRDYLLVASELCVIGYLVLRGLRIVIPQKLRQRVLDLAHEGHLGVVATKANLRTKVWWPGMDKAAEKHCRSCHGCQLVARPDQPEPITSSTLPDGPWRDIAVDLMGPLPSGQSLLVVADYYSRYYEVAVMKSTTAEKVIECLEEIFCRHGLPTTMKSDNGPQFISQEFATYCDDNGIEHCRTTAKWAQANGEVERQNQSLLKRMRIAQAQNKDWQREMRKYLMQYRALPHNTTGRSPAEMLFNRHIRTKLPLTGAGYHPLDQEVRDRDAEQKMRAKLYADNRRGAKYSDVNVGDTVLIQQERENKLTTPFSPVPHKVVSKTGNSLIAESPEGVRYQRNTTHVRKYLEPPQGGGEDHKHAHYAGATRRCPGREGNV